MPDHKKLWDLLPILRRIRAPKEPDTKPKKPQDKPNRDLASALDFFDFNHK